MAEIAEAFHWTDYLTTLLLALYIEYEENFANVDLKAVPLWEEIAEKLKEDCEDETCTRWPTGKQCANRFESLKASTQKYLGSLKATGAGKKAKREPPYHTMMMDIIGHRTSVKPTSVASSGSIVASLSTRKETGASASRAVTPSTPLMEESADDLDFPEHATGPFCSVASATATASHP